MLLSQQITGHCFDGWTSAMPVLAYEPLFVRHDFGSLRPFVLRWRALAGKERCAKPPSGPRVSTLFLLRAISWAKVCVRVIFVPWQCRALLALLFFPMPCL